MASRHAPEPPNGADGAPPGRPVPGSAPTDRARGIRMAVLGGVVMVLAPLFGFLGGSMAGVDDISGGPDPLAVWLLAGMVVGAFGGIVAILGVLRWSRSSAQARTRTGRP